MKQILILMILCVNCAYGGFFDQHANGWHWYEDKSFGQENEENETQDRETIGRQDQKKPKTPTQILNDFKKEIEGKLHAAIVNPTHNNIKQYQLIQKKLVDHTQKFGQRWMEVVYTNPELDHTIKNPISQVGRHVHLDEEHKKMDRLIGELSQRYGLFFFFKADCPYCHAFAPIVKQFSNQYGWSVVAISSDGSTLPEFPDARSDNGIIEKLEITVFPTLLAVDPQTNDIIPISFGLSTFDQMFERVSVLVNLKRGE